MHASRNGPWRSVHPAHLERWRSKNSGGERLKQRRSGGRRAEERFCSLRDRACQRRASSVCHLLQSEVRRRWVMHSSVSVSEHSQQAVRHDCCMYAAPRLQNSMLSVLLLGLPTIGSILLCRAVCSKRLGQGWKFFCLAQAFSSCSSWGCDLLVGQNRGSICAQSWGRANRA
jgi:hypothetical protein